MKQKNNFPSFMRVAAITYDYRISPCPYSCAVPSSNASRFLVDGGFIPALAKALSFEYDILEPADNEYGRVLDDGNCTGMIGMLQRDEADIAVAKLSYTKPRAQVVDFSYPYEFSPVTFITDKPKYIRDGYAIVHPLSLGVWIAVALSLIFTILVTRIFKIRRYSFKKMSFDIFASLLEQSVTIERRRLSTKLLILSWFLGCMFVTFSYKAVLLSFFSFPSLVGISTIEELAAAAQKSSFKCASYETTRIYSEILNDEGVASWRIIYDCVVRTNMYTDDVESFLSPPTYQKAFTGSKPYLKSFQKTYFISDDAFGNDLFYVAIRKSFCCKDALDSAIHRITALGILKKIHEDEEFSYSLSEADPPSEDDGQTRELSLEDLSAAFIILASGYILASIVFTLEVLLNKKSKSR